MAAEVYNLKTLEGKENPRKVFEVLSAQQIGPQIGG